MLYRKILQKIYPSVQQTKKEVLKIDWFEYLQKVIAFLLRNVCFFIHSFQKQNKQKSCQQHYVRSWKLEEK